MYRPHAEYHAGNSARCAQNQPDHPEDKNMSGICKQSKICHLIRPECVLLGIDFILSLLVQFLYNDFGLRL